MSQERQVRKVIFGDAVQDQMLEGIDQLLRTVRVTLGPGGRTVMINRPFLTPLSTKDGVTVAREVDLGPGLEGMAVEAIKEAAKAAVKDAGDGTTSTTLLAGYTFKELAKLTSAGFNPVLLQNAGLRILPHLLNEVGYYSMQVDSSAQIAHVATQASNGDTRLGDLIAEAMERAGEDGVIVVDEGQKLTTDLEFSEGMQWDRGYAHALYAEHHENMAVLYDQPLILIMDKNLDHPQEIVPVLEYILSETHQPLVIVAHDFSEEVHAVLSLNMMKVGLHVCCVKAPSYAQKRSEWLQDMAVLTGGEVVGTQSGYTCEKPQLILGSCAKIEVLYSQTTILGGAGETEAIETHLNSLRAQIPSLVSDHDIEWYQQRLSQLSGGVVVIKVGAPSEYALKEFKGRIEDALAATKAAVRGGIVPGAASIYALLADMCFYQEQQPEFELEDKLVWGLLGRSFSNLHKAVYENARLDPRDYQPVIQEDGSVTLYDLRSKQWVDAFEGGVTDPTLVVKSVLTYGLRAAFSLGTACCALVHHNR